MSNIAQIIKDFVANEFMGGGGGGAVGDDEPLIQAGVVDSFGIFVLAAFLEDQFSIKIHPEDIILDNFETVRAISRLVAARRASAPAS